MNQTIIARLLSTSQRVKHVGKLFGVRFLWIESFVFDTAGSLAASYDGGSWDYFALSNGGFYMRPTSGGQYSVASSNGFKGELSADAFGITSCLTSYSLLSFSADRSFAEQCAEHYHMLREFMLQHPERIGILAAID